jgi:hypothetical protein
VQIRTSQPPHSARHTNPHILINPIEITSQDAKAISHHKAQAKAALDGQLDH